MSLLKSSRLHRRDTVNLAVWDREMPHFYLHRWQIFVLKIEGPIDDPVGADGRSEQARECLPQWVATRGGVGPWSEFRGLGEGPPLDWAMHMLSIVAGIATGRLIGVVSAGWSEARLQDTGDGDPQPGVWHARRQGADQQMV